MYRKNLNRIVWLACLAAAFTAAYTIWLSVVYREGILYLEGPSPVLEYGTWRRVSALLAPLGIAAFVESAVLGVQACRLHGGSELTERQSRHLTQSVLLVYGVGLAYSLYVTLRFRSWQLYVRKELYTAGDLPIDFGSCLYPVIAAAACMILYILFVGVCRAELTK